MFTCIHMYIQAAIKQEQKQNFEVSKILKNL